MEGAIFSALLPTTYPPSPSFTSAHSSMYSAGETLGLVHPKTRAMMSATKDSIVIGRQAEVSQ